MSKEACRPIFYDTETTGVKSEKDYIIEIAAFDPVQDRTFEKLIRPAIPIPAEATAVHKITDAMVANAPPFSEIGKEFAEFCSGNVVLIAHNNDNFDLPFLKAEYKRSEIDFPNWKFFDTLKWARRYRPDLPRHALQFLREIYDIPANNAHRALDDVIVLHKVYSCMVDDLSIDTAFSLLNKKRSLKQMPFGKHRGVALDKVPSSYVKWLAGSGALDKPESSELKESFLEIMPEVFA